MIKQAVLFVASTGLLVYFIMPADKEKPSQPAVQEASGSKSNSQKEIADSWYADSGDEEDFVFGEPLVYSEEDKPSSNNVGEEEGGSQPVVNDVARIEKKRNYVSPAVYNKAPKPGGLGSKERPIDMSPPGGRQKF
ncbi:hypothetical protein [Parasphingorhabdus cellanae]|uniref:Uncharacterized protein n=1 Tax=Parasphingorhabdus cellanae TaxID=2806553 RepID=A0ABX7T4X4_9SPHN|nr:hypothetical protein [Parasphingorhabdus cellanae]QTD56635.1 hypothetical protein J4G78_03325 [Parasphingorhabdus cellanae]